MSYQRDQSQHKLTTRRWKIACGLILLPILAGCASREHLYTTDDLPAALFASRYQLPFSADLSNSVVRTTLSAIEPGDTVEIALLNSTSLDGMSSITTSVAPDGTVVLPALGKVSLTGVPLQSASEAVIRTSLASNQLSSQSLHVTLKAPRQNRVTVLGAVAHPGVYLLPRNESDLVAALAVAGGLNRGAGRRVVIQGPTIPVDSPVLPETLPPSVDMTDVTVKGSPADSLTPGRRTIDLTDPSALQPTAIGDGEVVIVEQSEVPSVLVIGTVGKPGRYEFPADGTLTALDAISTAQGIPNKVVDTVVVCRQLPNQDEKALIQISLRAATRNPDDDLLLMPGDIVSVEPTPRSLMKDTFKYVRSAVGGASMFFISK